MRKQFMAVLLSSVICAMGIVSSSWGSESYPCGTSDAATISEFESVFAPTDSVVNVRILFVGFPDNDTLSLPVWADSLRNDLPAYITAMSQGKQRLDVRIMKRTDDSTHAWVAQFPAKHYAHIGTNGFGYLNTEIMQHVAAVDSTAWDDVQCVIVMDYECAFGCTDTTSGSNCETSCPFAGLAGLALTSSVSHFSGTGLTERVLYWPNLNTTLARRGAEYLSAHEYGHLLGWRHTIGSEPPEGTGVTCRNIGRYDQMRAVGTTDLFLQGAMPYHPLQLANSDVGPNWVARSVITSDTLGLHIKDLRSTSAPLYEVAIPGAASRQAFILANYSGTSAYDRKFGRTGLLIWHVGRYSDTGDQFWDLESAAGRFTSGSPNPNTGTDSLEAIAGYLGSGNDFYDGVHASDFSGSTNPNTNRYTANTACTLAQSVKSSVGIENIHVDSGTGDVIVDIFLSPRQIIIKPNGGESLTEGVQDTIRWKVRDKALITNVDVLVSHNNGSTYDTLGHAVANTGAFLWTPSGTGSTWLARVVSRDSAGASGFDGSDATFSVVDRTAPATVTGLMVGCGRTTVAFAWTAPGDDGDTGTAAEYDLRYSSSAITEGNFSAQSRLSTDAPQEAGSYECVLISGGSCSWYYGALKAKDEAGNWSAMSNVASAQTACSGTVQVGCDNLGFTYGDSLEDESALHGRHPDLVPSAEPLPVAFALASNRPNPFTRVTVIAYELPRRSAVNLDVFDAQGRLVRQLVHGIREAGRWKSEWDCRDANGRLLGPGVYLCRMQADGFRANKRMVLLP